ncbi:phosphonate metabolism protein PhnM [Bradyrhizobium sp. i1.4.4]
MTDIFLEGGRALIGSELVETSILVSGADIAQVDASRGRARLAIDARNLLVLPGIVDLHGDAFERQMMPRAGVDFPIDVALADSDRQAISNGITTVFHATTCSWEPGLRSAGNARALMEAIERQRPQFAADTRFHLRHETYNLEVRGRDKPVARRGPRRPVRLQRPHGRHRCRHGQAAQAQPHGGAHRPLGRGIRPAGRACAFARQ